MAQLAPVADPRLLVGPETLDDAAALLVRDDMAICFTADLLTPLVDDPHQWGRIAAANSISDVYAMGATPLAALNIVGWPARLPPAMLAEVLSGGAEIAREAGCLVVGGHTMTDSEPKYGMAVIGVARPERIVRNQGARPGDALYLTKPLGTGILATAVKLGVADASAIDAAVTSMTRLNRAASETALTANVRAMTDVTGFGLVGHVSEMLGGSDDLGVALDLDALPLLPDVESHLLAGHVPGGAYCNLETYGKRVDGIDCLREPGQMILFDPQTSGGLLIALDLRHDAVLREEAGKRNVGVHRIGQFTDTGRIEVLLP